MSIEVGSIIYIIDPQKKVVVPARVNEQLVSRTVQGENITHNVELPSGKSKNLESLGTAFFSSLDEVRDYLLNRAKEVIEMGIKSAESVALEKFGDLTSVDQENILEQAASQETIKVTLENGQQANVKLPPEFLNENTGN